MNWYLVLYWDEYGRESKWILEHYTTSKKEAVKEFNRCKKEYRWVKLVKCETLLESADY